MVLGLFRPKPVSPRLERLRSLFLFVDLTPAELAIVDGLVHERTFLNDEVVFDEGDDGQAIYIVLEGEVIICRQGRPDDGRLALLGAGSFFGELALLDEGPRAAQARAVGNCRLLVFFREDFMGLLDTHARIASKVGRQLARHLGRRMRVMAKTAETCQHL